ncbi:oxidoreductase [Planotetraspora thailandica]|uniref:Oxidoreductase n=1 Tax=Planotetraspora thailandica TaxID=487172 RepID=A0A8J3UVB0_9ACTN|nr:oxidoreductase [Planotetraspora thailandica]GII52659.1 oxidoreductase [Planotetraspora thailandica]
MTATTRTARWTPEAIADLHGRTAFITGGNSGIGLETARVLAVHGARVILAGRNQDKLDEAVAEIRKVQPDARLDTAVVDLGSLASIRTATARVAETETIDLLFNNAGVMNVPERRTTSDGFELTFGTNHLGHFALTAGLMPALRRSRAARIVTVSAIAATWRSGRLADLMSERSYGAMTAYAKSKRANVAFTQELARRLTGTTVEAVVVHPGSAVTNLQRHSEGPLARAFVAIASRLLLGSPEGAAWPSLYAGTSPDVRSGQFIGPAGRDQTSGTPRPVALPDGAGDPAEGAFLWAESERLTGVRFDL